MTRVRIGLVATCVVLPAVPASGQPLAAVTGSAAVAPRVAERDRLRATALEKMRAGDHPADVNAARDGLALDRAIFGPESGAAADGLGVLAGPLERSEDWVAAGKARDEALAIRTKLHGPKDWRATDARLAAEHGRLAPDPDGRAAAEAARRRRPDGGGPANIRDGEAGRRAGAGRGRRGPAEGGARG